MIECPSIEQIDRYIAGDCTPDERREVESHLAKCETCRQRIEFAQKNGVVQGLSGDKRALSPSDRLKG